MRGHHALPLTFEDPRRVLARHGIRPKRAWSQSFLVNAGAVSQIASLVGAAPDETVVEIGAGIGTLTRALAESGARVVAIEPERDALRVLRAEVAELPNVEVLEADALEVDLAALGPAGKVRVVGNLPYGISAPLLVRIAESAARLSRAVCMVQAEVADRVAASPGGKAYGALTIAVQGAMSAKIGLTLGPGSFHPRPKVRSKVLVLQPRDPPLVEAGLREAVRRVVRAAFERRRKTLANALTGVVADASVVARALGQAGIDPKRRGETLSVEEFASLARAISRTA